GSRGRAAELGRGVARKVLPERLARTPTTLERFRREARHAARLSHKNIVTLFEWGQDRGTYFLAMELVEGFDLYTYIARRGRLDPQEASVITVPAARALAPASSTGTTHRDITPSTFLLTPAGGKLRVKLTDFGLARADWEEDFRVTRDGSTVGTIDYLSPEQARDSAAADV